MTLKLIELDLSYKEAYLDYIKEWEGEDFVPLSANLQDLPFEVWLEMRTKFKDKDYAEALGMVPDYTYFLIDTNTNRLLGAINFRHFLNAYLLNYGGHIGYGIRKSERCKGYAKKMLELCLEEIKNGQLPYALDKILITCDKNNHASGKTIQHCNGVLENEVTHDNEIVQRYWITIK